VRRTESVAGKRFYHEPDRLELVEVKRLVVVVNVVVGRGAVVDIADIGDSYLVAVEGRVSQDLLIGSPVTVKRRSDKDN